MTKEELDKEVVNKKIAKMDALTINALITNFVEGFAFPVNMPTEVVKSLIDLNLVKKATQVPPGVIFVNKPAYYLQLTSFGQKVKRTLSIKTIPSIVTW